MDFGPGIPACVTVVRLTKIHEEQRSSITNRSARSSYPKKKSVLTERIVGVPHDISHSDAQAPG